MAGSTARLLECGSRYGDIRQKRGVIGRISGPWCVPGKLGPVYLTLMSIFHSYDFPGLPKADTLFTQSSLINIPDGSSYFADVPGPVFPNEVCMVQGAFMPQDPFILCLTSGQVSTPYMFLAGYRFFVHCGSLLHHELDFHFHQGCIMVCLDGHKITSLIPDYLRCCRDNARPSSQSGLRLSEFHLPLLGGYNYLQFSWHWDDVDSTLFNMRQMECLLWLERSWWALHTLGMVVGK